MSGPRRCSRRNRAALTRELSELLGHPARLIPETCKDQTVAIITGGAGSSVREAAERGCDTFITGEGHTHLVRRDGTGSEPDLRRALGDGDSGVKALAARIGQEFGLPWEFFAQPTGL